MIKGFSLIFSILLVFNSALASNESSIEKCDTQKCPQTLDKNNFNNLETIAKHRGKPRIFRVPYPKLPPNFEKISQGIMESVCSRVMQSSYSGGFTGLINDIRKYYGDPREFFYKYVMSLPCRRPSVSLADSILKKGFINKAFSNIFMKFCGVDPNSFVVIRKLSSFICLSIHPV